MGAADENFATLRRKVDRLHILPPVPAVEKAFEVLEQLVSVLLDEALDAVLHLARVVRHLEVAPELQRLLARLELQQQET